MVSVVMSRRSTGSTPIDRLGSHYENVDVTCPDCGYVDEDASWTVKGNGKRVDYQHRCPSCGQNRIRTLALDR